MMPFQCRRRTATSLAHRVGRVERFPRSHSLANYYPRKPPALPGDWQIKAMISAGTSRKLVAIRSTPSLPGPVDPPPRSCHAWCEALF